ncbi:carbon monoxide dehydrogenase, medium subunit [Tistlia consotensis]|uniref:Carbon monoxide dehydrogenase, medium subunit n=1 Tax=Tistlia consotensis USBA 355 TaxID=560819 RepID=A0A1Y6CHA7_9PROT|nr:xanthine dehydrogenase family protein subunit M [Tistlia consotensis]SMF64280.1 carbon monoxide dehydrogenase, medium subunit [Tistlia consotensis USBA 355]SNR97583.1 carbon monoxide dehydrogenase, medium subunit [Tistlia consotensis]
MIPGSFDYHRPRTLEEAVSLLASLGEESRVVAGGHSLIPMMKLRMALPEHLVDLQDVAELKGIRIDGSQITIGAMTTQAEMIASAELARLCPILRETALQIADPQIRSLGTVGGNVANGDPGNDLPGLMQALDARYLLRGPGGERELPARAFYEGPFTTALDPGEVLAAVRIAAPAAGHGWAYEKQKRKIGDYATAAAAVLLELEGGTCRKASIALTNVGDTPLLAEAAGRALVGTAVDAAAVKAAAEAAKAIAAPAEDGRGPRAFRVHLTDVMVTRAVEKARSRAS